MQFKCYMAHLISELYFRISKVHKTLWSSEDWGRDLGFEHESVNPPLGNVSSLAKEIKVILSFSFFFF